MKKICTVFSIALMMLIGSTWTGCKNEKDDVTTDLVNNPLSASDEQSDELPVWKFDEEVYFFGKVVQGEKVTHEFKFTNIGKKDLIITSAQGSCGCTVPEYPKHPIKPGESAAIKVIFDTNGKTGQQNKTVTLVANTVPNTKVLALKGEVLVPGEN
jgi:hypothetical protein